MDLKRKASNIFTIPAGRPFVDALAAGLAARAGGDWAMLAEYTILVPTRRAVRSLRDAFLRRSGGQVLLLPRMMPLGDLDEEELAIASADELPDAAAWDVPPAISGMHRQLALAKHIRTSHGGKISVEQAALLAAELARFLDQV